MKDFIAVAWLRFDSPFYAIFGNGIVPIKSVEPSEVSLIGSPETSVYFLDWEACSHDEKFALANELAAQRGGEHFEVFQYAETGGDIPIRVSQTVMVTSDVRIFR